MKIDRQQLEETYRSRTDEELLRIAADTVALTQEASQLLGYELQRRHLGAPDAGPKKCPGCGLLNPDSAPTCDCGFDFKTHTQRSFEEAYAAVSQRFVAYLADLIIVYLIVLSGYFVSGLLGKPLSSTEAPATAFLYLALFAYMTVAQAAYHTTVGKYVIGLEVASATSEREYPSLGRILIRETVGRIVSSLFWGAGYWVAIRNPRKQAWSDRMADTIVRVRQTHRPFRRALTAFVLISLVTDVGLTVWGYQVEQRTKAYNAVVQEEQSVSTKIEGARQAATSIVERRPRNLGNFQSNMRELLPYLDQYDQQIDRLQSLYQRALNEGIISSEAERNRVKVLQRVFQLRKDQSEKQREEAKLVLRFDPPLDDRSGFLTHLKLLDSDIAGLENQATQMLTEIGNK